MEVRGARGCLSSLSLGDVLQDFSLRECANKMGKRREKTKWSHLDWSQDRGQDRGGGNFKRSSAVVGPRFEKQQQLSSVVEQQIISDFCCVEQLPDGFTKIRYEESFINDFLKLSLHRSKNLDIIFKRDFYENKMMASPYFYDDGDVTTTDATAFQSSFIFDQMDLDEIPEFRPRDGSFASIGNDSGYSTSFQEVYPEQVPYPPPPPPAPYLPFQPVPQFYLYSPGAHTLIPCEEIIISNTILSAEGPVYQSPTKAYVAYPVQGHDGFITQPFTVPDISGLEEHQHGGMEHVVHQPRSEVEERGKMEPLRSTQTPGIKQLSTAAPAPAPEISNYIPGLPLQTIKTKKRRKKKAKSKLAAGETKVFTSSSESEARETREAVKNFEVPEFNEEFLCYFDPPEASEAINGIELTDDLTNSLVNPPTEDDDVEDTKITGDLINLIEVEAENVSEVPPNVQCSYSEAVRKEILLKPSIDEITIPTKPFAQQRKSPEKPSNVKNSKSKTKTKKKKTVVTKMEVEPESLCSAQEQKENPTINCQVVEESQTEPPVSTNEDCSVSPSEGQKEQKEQEDKEEERERETAKDPMMTVPQSPLEHSVKPKKSRKRKGRERRGQSPLQRVLVVDDQVSVSPV